jgi:NAD(P)-dependent dehydrogenase (short-subunit alcohol dehydrogenase family)
MSKIAIVTGNGKGLGQRISERLVGLGYQLPDNVRSADYDLSKAEDASRLVQDTVTKYGRLDLLVNNIGNYVAKSIDDISVVEWKDLLGSNLNASFYMSKFALPHLRKSRGKIINIGFASLESCSPEPNIIAYHTAKMGLLSLTQGLAKSEAASGVLVNMVSPGSMENTVKHNAISKIPLGRLATLDEVTDVVLLLVSSDYITGQNLEVAGGWGL